MATGFVNLAEERPDELAIVDPWRQITWREFLDRATRVGRAFEDAGIGRGDHIAMLMGNRAEFVEILCASLLSGLVVTPVNWHFNADEVAYVVDNCDAKGIVVDDRHLDAAKQAFDNPALRCKVVTGRPQGTDLLAYESFLEGVDATPFPTDAEPGGYMLYTSGTTGRPKGVNRNIAPAGSTIESVLSLTALMGAPLGVQPGGAHLVTGPLYHAAPLGFSSMTFNGGSTMVIMDGWTPEATLDLMTKWGVTNTHMVATMFVRLLRLPEHRRRAFDPSRLQAVVHGAAPCPVWVKEAMIDWWGPVLFEYYGATEGGLTTIGPEDWLAHKGSVGRPAPIYSVEIRDDDGTLLGTGEQGTVWFRSLLGQETFAYYKDDEKTRSAHLEPGVFTLGDVGCVDGEGYLYLTDRKSDMIISGGVNIYPREVEQVLTTHPAVADVAVFGIPNDEWGEEVKAAVELVPGQHGGPELERELLEFCRERMAHYKCPRTVDFEAELPRHATGKLYKRLLRDRYWHREGRFI